MQCKKITTLMAVWALILCQLQAQTSFIKKPLPVLGIGDQLPAIVLKGMINQPSRNGTKLHVKTDLLLLDFWATWCGSCIAGFDKLDKLKKQFGNKLDILLVTQEDRLTVDKFSARRKALHLKGLSFDCLVGDQTLQAIFPHESIPHYVWVDKKGIVRAITDAASITEENIAGMLAGQQFDLSLKDDAAKESFHDPLKPLFVNGNGGEGKNLLWQSVLSGEVKGLQNISLVSAGKKAGMVQLPNADVYSFYKTAYGDNQEIDFLRLPDSRVVFKVRDSSKYFATFKGQVHTSGDLYCYGLYTPPVTMEHLKLAMQDDLKKYFHLNAGWERKRMPCLVLTAEDSSLLAPIAPDKIDPGKHASSSYHYTSQNNPLKIFRQALEESYLYGLPYPILDETGIRGLVYFELEADMGDWRSIDGSLSKYKMHLRLEDRWVNVLVVTEPD